MKTERSRIALVTRGKILAGAERQLLYLAQGLDRHQFDPHVLTFFDGPVAATARQAGLATSVVQRRGRQMWEDPTLPIRLAAILREFARISRGVVVATFAHARTLQATLRRMRAARDPGRMPIYPATRQHVYDEATAAGLQPTGDWGLLPGYASTRLFAFKPVAERGRSSWP